MNKTNSETPHTPEHSDSPKPKNGEPEATNTLEASSSSQTHADEPTMTSLTTKEEKSLKELERQILKSQRTWRVRARALSLIQSKKLWRGNYDSFGEYTEDRWDIKRARAYQLIIAAEFCQHIEDVGSELPASDSHVRALTGIPEVQQALDLWDRIVTQAGDASRVTRALADAVAAEYETEIQEEVTSSGGRIYLTDEAKDLIESRTTPKATGVEKKQPDTLVLPLVTVPPSYLDHDVTQGPAIVPADLIGDLNEETISSLSEQFAAHYQDQSKTGPVMNLTNEHVGWACWTLNVVTGCNWGCSFCYAREIAELRYPQGFAPTVHPERFAAPSNTKIPKRLEGDDAARRVFLGSQADWMDPSFPDSVIQATLDMCRANPEWTFMTLTKQPARLTEFEFPSNVWVGVTVTRQGQVKAAEAAFAKIDAAVRWVSFEPLHGQVVLERPELVDLYVIGAERKTRQRPMVKETEAKWVDVLRLQARNADMSIWEKENLRVHLREMPTPREFGALSTDTKSTVDGLGESLGAVISTAPDRGSQPPKRFGLRKPSALADDHFDAVKE